MLVVDYGPAPVRGAGSGRCTGARPAHGQTLRLPAGAAGCRIGPGPRPGPGVVRTLMAWTTLFGTVSFEIFGHLVGSVTDPEAWFDAVALRLAADLGIR